MPERTLIQKLDWILQAINDNKANEEIESAYNWNTNELVEILEKLDRDGYIKRKAVPGTYHFSNTPTVEGRLFIGYEKTRLLQDEHLIASSQRDLRARIYENRLLYATWCAGIAALLLLFWEIFLYYFPTYKDYPYHWIWENITK